MGRFYWRPNVAAAVDYGDVDTDGSGTVLGDNSDSTKKKYFKESGSILSFVLPPPSVIPAGRKIIAVRVGHRQRNELVLFNGWVNSYLRIDGKKQANTRAYKQDGYSDSVREIIGPALYNKNLVEWTWAEVQNMGAESGAAVGEIGPDKGKYWCVCTETFIQLVYNDLVPVPSSPYPANGATIDTSSVQFSAQAPATQEEQPVRTVFQVCRVNTFDNDDVRTFIGGLNQSTTGTSRSYYVSDVTKPETYTNLGPGVWYLRIKNRDYRGDESTWSSATSFTIAHGPLPTPSLVDPIASQSVNSPYRIRTGRISAQPSGGRKVGITWQFAKDAGFTNTVRQWTNSADGTFIASAEFPFDVSYNPQPNPQTVSGLAGGTVGVDDPTQYLAQGTWYARVRCTDVWGQSGTWSSAITFLVTHPPIPTLLIPSGGVSFDQHEAPVKWSFTDPWNNDYQTSYQMRVLDASANLLQDTGKISSGLTKGTMNVPNTYLRQNLTITVDVWDADDIKNTVGNQLTGVCRLSTAPITTIVFPGIGETINSGQPNFQWTNVFAAGGITQQSFAIKVIESQTGTTVYESGVITSSSNSHLPQRPILKNLKGYKLALTITDSENLSKTVYQNFATNFDRPEIVDCFVNTLGYNDFGYTEITWPDGNPDPYFKEWRIYRKRQDDSDDQYVLAGVVEDSGIKFFQDWLIAGNDTFVYTVVQVAYRFGSLVESGYNPSTPFFIFSDSYWLIVPTNPDLNIKIRNTSADRYTDNREMADYNIIGGGRRRAYGTKYGKSGNLTIQVRASQGRTSSQFIDGITRVCRDQYSLFMRDPFGNVTLIALGEMSLDRMAGVGSVEFGDIDLPYIEVSKQTADMTPTIVGGITFIESPPGSGLMIAVNLQG